MLDWHTFCSFGVYGRRLLDSLKLLGFKFTVDQESKMNFIPDVCHFRLKKICETLAEFSIKKCDIMKINIKIICQKKTDFVLQILRNKKSWLCTPGSGWETDGVQVELLL
jgi:hypothetical protein